MKKKKFERQQRERTAKEQQKRESLPMVELHPSTTYPGEYWWRCPVHSETSFTYSPAINAQWGHPEDLVFCAVCYKYYRFTKPEPEVTLH